MEKNTGKVREFCQPGKVGTLSLPAPLLSLFFLIKPQYEPWRGHRSDSIKGTDYIGNNYIALNLRVSSTKLKI